MITSLQYSQSDEYDFSYLLNSDQSLTINQQLNIIEKLQQSHDVQHLFSTFSQEISAYLQFSNIRLCIDNRNYIEKSNQNGDTYTHKIHLRSSPVDASLIINQSVCFTSSQLSYLYQFSRLLKTVLPQTLSIEQLQQQLRIDYLTGIANRCDFDTNLKQSIAHNQRCSYGLQLLLFDLDNFKHINDRFGHLVGDKALIHVAHGLKESCRNGDHISRLGGDEFAIILQPAREKAAEVVSRRINKWLAIHPFEQNIQLTMSSGYATWRKGMNTDTLINAADQAMYRNKFAN
ncbi:MAG: hypothetical protein CENE_00430 [Candidatus Celerinatantimonas neptuna]|nr:MAG: hypothetical protein CENE_00430 [Candidatus Celerinatantimonas neptuna]